VFFSRNIWQDSLFTPRVWGPPANVRANINSPE
jgi:hypothetical protein